jgi:hypothetical protein
VSLSGLARGDTLILFDGGIWIQLRFGVPSGAPCLHLSVFVSVSLSGLARGDTLILFDGGIFRTASLASFSRFLLTVFLVDSTRPDVRHVRISPSSPDVVGSVFFPKCGGGTFETF